MIDYCRAGQRIKTVRRFKGWTQEELAKKSGIDPLAVEAIERGECSKYDSIDAVCHALDVDTEYTLNPRNKIAEERAWGNLTDEEFQKLRRVAEILKQKNGPGA